MKNRLIEHYLQPGDPLLLELNDVSGDREERG
jgi:hypothetical protein